MTVEIPGYRILSTLGKGGMATVYLAEHEIFQRKVALKVMAPGLADDPSFGQRFMREARIVSQLVHPNIVTVYDVGVHQGNYYLSMEFIDGEDLKHARRQLTLEQKILVVLDIAKALAYAGNKGYVHRDIKPENIMLYRDDGRAVLTDFGIARAAELDTCVTQTGTAIGTPHYMSPEQAKGQPVDMRSDIYSLGVVFYLLLVGCVPFDAESAVAIGIKHITEPVPELPQGLEGLQPIIDRMLAKLPADRYQSPNELVRDLQQLDLAELVATADEAFGQAEASLSGDADAPTLVSRPRTRAARTPRPTGAGVEQEPTPLLVNEPFVLEEDSSSIWPWLAGILVLLAVVGGVYYSQYLADNGGWPPELTTEPSPEPAPPRSEPPAVEETGPPVPADPGAPAPGEDPQPSQEDRVAELQQRVDELQAAVVEDPQQLEPLLSAWRELEQLGGADADMGGVARAVATEADRVRQLAQAGEIAAAERRLDQLSRLAPTSANVDLAALKAEVAQQAKVDKLVEAGYSLLADDKLTRPAERNARVRFEEAVALDPGHPRAEEGLAAVAERLAQLGGQAVEEGDAERAESLLERAAEIAPGNPTVGSLRRRIEEAHQAQREEAIASLLQRAEAQMEEAAYYSPAGDSAYDYFNRVLELDPDNAAARAGLQRTQEGFEERLLNLLAQDHTGAVRDLLAKARERLPTHPELAAIELRVEEAIEERFLAAQPRVTEVSISGSRDAADGAADEAPIQADRSIFVDFQYENFGGETSVLHAILMDGSRSVYIAQVPVVVPGDAGSKSFRIDRPVEGFPAGRYSIDLLYRDRTLAARDFQVR